MFQNSAHNFCRGECTNIDIKLCCRGSVTPMAPSQLKKLKASLRESGVVGPQKSKKQKKQAGKSGALREGRIQRNEALHNIRERFAPFEAKAPVRNKFEFVSRNGVVGKASKGVVGRPGITKAIGEENVGLSICISREAG